jgi:uncharacterized protein YkwD
MPKDRAGNNFKQARTINLKSSSRALTDWVGSTDQNDYYKLRLNKSSSLNLQLSQLNANANVELLTRKGKVVGRSSQKGTRQESLQFNLEQGTYYVRVYRNKGNTRYQLNMSLASNAELAASQPLHPFIQRVLDLTNLQRQKAGMQPLRLNSQLNTAAQTYSQTMALDDFFSHTGADGSRMSDRIDATGYQYWSISENIAGGYSKPEMVVDKWMQSPGHRANILDPNFTEIGIGYYHLANDTGTINYHHYWTQNFGAPLA